MINKSPRRTHRQELWQVFWMIAPCELNPRYWHLFFKQNISSGPAGSECMREDYELKVFIKITSLMSLSHKVAMSIKPFSSFSSSSDNWFFLQVSIICHSNQNSTIYVYILQVVTRHTSWTHSLISWNLVNPSESKQPRGPARLRSFENVLRLRFVSWPRCAGLRGFWYSSGCSWCGEACDFWQLGGGRSLRSCLARFGSLMVQSGEGTRTSTQIRPVPSRT